MDGYIERQTLQDIADAIREKNGSEETYKPSEMAEAIREIEGGGEGFDLTEFGTTKEYSQKTNEDFLEIVRASENNKSTKAKKGGIILSNTFKIPYNADNYGTGVFCFYWTNDFDYTHITTNLRGNFNGAVIFNLAEYIYAPKAVGMNGFYFKTTIVNIPDTITFDFGEKKSNSTVQVWDPFSGCTVINKDNFSKIIFKGNRIIKFIGVNTGNIKSGADVEFLDSENCTEFKSQYSGAVTLGDVSKATELNFAYSKNVKFKCWKKTNCKLSTISALPTESIHYIIQNAVSLVDGATARTLTLHATAKANWEASEYYEQDLAVLEEKGITIA